MLYVSMLIALVARLGGESENLLAWAMSDELF